MDAHCVESPAGVMGCHHVNFALFGAPLDVRKPAILVYQPTPAGGRELVAVEYAAVDQDQKLDTDSDRPYLFRQCFDGPMPAHVAAQPGGHVRPVQPRGVLLAGP
ncbi:hypothetical protein [Lentzea terrae]|uniref:hypothetical protein n=1 Tax=Lentzea terrae TaxID=2200761 RepID=UPI000DD47E22|nr:hypothetical protein [Lentzea terrae]